MPAVTFVVDAETPQQSGQAVLHGRRDLVPLISGSVSGATIGIAWIVGLLMYAYKRWKGHQAVRNAGLRSHRELDVPPPKPEAFIIPPDPAVIQGIRAPGERIVPDDPKADVRAQPEHAKTIPLARTEVKGGKEKEPGVVSASQLSTHSLPATIHTQQETCSLSSRHTRRVADG
ncbi:uncharacterized protein FIBRA_03990 [Fibroporia radiculosa]|uniref:Uncharacterized protein n=1 Tax=Fibroporia radiculosa TaxID=599839 RepID=J4G6P3_9APHY|nr:uncharacterized protein FIBRA_03990 [Fibroporia radiculosa]CCM01918.1 predicted protein [Fibroporia radiculosa]